jgi:hypothetical protein
MGRGSALSAVPEESEYAESRSNSSARSSKLSRQQVQVDAGSNQEDDQALVFRRLKAAYGLPPSSSVVSYLPALSFRVCFPVETFSSPSVVYCFRPSGAGSMGKILFLPLSVRSILVMVMPYRYGMPDNCARYLAKLDHEVGEKKVRTRACGRIRRVVRIMQVPPILCSTTQLTPNPAELVTKAYTLKPAQMTLVFGSWASCVHPCIRSRPQMQVGEGPIGGKPPQRKVVGKHVKATVGQV